MSDAVAKLPTYWVGNVVNGRGHVDHGFTITSLLELRRKQQLAPIMISFNWLTPFFSSTQNSIKELEEESEMTGKKPSNEDLLPIVTNAATSATKHWGGVLIRVGLQTTIASALIHHDTPLCHSIVHNWDMYPRMHQKYVGDFLQKIYLPRSLASLMGPATKVPADLEMWECEVSPVAAAQDSFKRHALVTASNITVTLVMHAIVNGFTVDRAAEEKEQKRLEKEHQTKVGLATAHHGADFVVPAARVAPRKMDFFQVAKITITTEFLSLLGCMAGAAVGRSFGGGRAEYWTEFLGAFIAGAAGSLITVKGAMKEGNKAK